MKKQLLILLLPVFATGCAPKPVKMAQTQNAPPPMCVPPPVVVTRPSEEPPAPPLVESQKLAEETLTLARSVEGRPIQLHVLGDGHQHVLIVAGLHGNEPTGCDLANALLEYLRAHPAVCEGRRIAVAPAVNPDGLLRHERTNANRVDINRNFGASNWSRPRTGRNSSGRVPGSEPETQAVMVAVQLTEPVRILVIHSIERGRHCNNYDGPAAALAQAMSARNGYPARPTMGYDTPGSFGTWAGIDRRIPTITLELPRDAGGAQCWEANREALLTFIAGG